MIEVMEGGGRGEDDRGGNGGRREGERMIEVMERGVGRGRG